MVSDRYFFTINALIGYHLKVIMSSRQKNRRFRTAFFQINAHAGSLYGSSQQVLFHC